MTIDEKIKQWAKGFVAELSGDCEYCDSNESSFERGANALKSEMLADMQKLADALEWRFRSKHFPSIGTNDDCASIANRCLDEISTKVLAEFNAKYKEQK